MVALAPMVVPRETRVASVSSVGSDVSSPVSPRLPARGKRSLVKTTWAAIMQKSSMVTCGADVHRGVDLDEVADDDVVRDVGLLADDRGAPDGHPSSKVYVVPDLRAVAERDPLLDERGGMNEMTLTTPPTR